MPNMPILLLVTKKLSTDLAEIWPQFFPEKDHCSPNFGFSLVSKEQLKIKKFLKN